MYISRVFRSWAVSRPDGAVSFQEHAFLLLLLPLPSSVVAYNTHSHSTRTVTGVPTYNHPAVRLSPSFLCGGRLDVSPLFVALIALVQAVMAPIAKAAKSMNKTTPPRAFEFSVGHPTGLTALDVDLIKVDLQSTGRSTTCNQGSRDQTRPRRLVLSR